MARNITNLLSNNGLKRRGVNHRILIEPALIVHGWTVRPGRIARPIRTSQEQLELPAVR